MSSFGEFIHVCQFYETILCFSILVLVGQRMIMMCRDLDQKYLKARARQFDDQIDWQKSFAREKQIIARQQEEQKRMQEQRQRQQQERKKRQQEKQNAQAPKQENLRTSLVQIEHDTTDRKLNEDQQTPERRKSFERKSLTELRRSRENNQNEIQIKDQESAKDSHSERRSSQVSAKNNQKQKEERRMSHIQRQNKQSRSKTINLQGADLNKVDINACQQPSISPQDDENEQDRLERQYKQKQKIRYFTRIDAIFNEYLPILMSTLVIGMLAQSTYIFTMVCFFGYMFASLLFNYANLLSKLKNEPTETSVFSKINKLISGLFILGLFINFWFDDEFA